MPRMNQRQGKKIPSALGAAVHVCTCTYITVTAGTKNFEKGSRKRYVVVRMVIRVVNVKGYGIFDKMQAIDWAKGGDDVEV